jgi:hypothetical protein
MTVLSWLFLILGFILIFYLWWFMALLIKHGGPRGLKAHIKRQLK